MSGIGISQDSVVLFANSLLTLRKTFYFIWFIVSESLGMGLLVFSWANAATSGVACSKVGGNLLDPSNDGNFGLLSSNGNLGTPSSDGNL